MKKCTKCKKLKKLSKFSIDNDKKDGHKPWCKECINANDKKKYWADVEKSRKKSKINTKRNAHSPRVKWSDYRKSAKIKDLQWDLTFEQFMSFWQQPCHYCGDKIETIGLDRVNSEKGYILSNLVSCCSKCNYAKRKMSQEEFINHCKKIANRF